MTQKQRRTNGRRIHTKEEYLADAQMAQRQRPQKGKRKRDPAEQLTETTATQGTLALQFTNLGEDGKGQNQNTIYAPTTSADQNNLQLELSVTGGDAIFNAGTLSKASPPTSTGSMLKLDLSPLGMTDDEFNAIQISVDKADTTVDALKTWTFAADTSTRSLNMAPSNDGTLPATSSDKIVFSITSMGIATAPPTSPVTLKLYGTDITNVGGAFGSQTSVGVSIMPPPDSNAGNLHDVLALEVTQPLILIDSTENSVKFSLKSIGKTVNVGKDTAFTVHFLYADSAADGNGALMTAANAAKSGSGAMNINPSTNATDWTITANRNDPNPNWTLTPPQGGVIVDAHSVVEFSIDNIDTDFPAGPTQIWLTWNSGSASTIPGYASGTLSGLLQKVARAKVNALTISPDPAYFDAQGSATVTVSWETENSTSLTLMPGSYNVTGTTSKTLRLTDTTTLSLTASGESVPGADNRDIKHVTATVLPTINSFAAWPTSIYYKDFTGGKDVYFSWAVNAPANTVVLESSDGSKNVEASQESNFPFSVQEPQMIKLTAGQGSSEIKRQMLISAFKPNAASYATTAAPSAVAVSPNRQFIAVSTDSGVEIMDTIAYSKLTTVTVGKKPLGIAFSTDGNTLFVANSGSNTVSVISVSGSYPFTFGTPTDITLSGAPQQIAVTETAVFVTVDKGNSNGALAIIKESGSSYQEVQTISVGKNPRGVAVSPSGAQIFVANQGDDTVSEISVTGGSTYSNATTITLPAQSTPSDVAVSVNGKVLLVVCSGTDEVRALDTEYPNSSLPTVLQVGSSPEQITVLPTGGYAFVTNSSDGTMSLLGCPLGIQNYSVIEPAISVGGTPTAVAVSPHGGDVYAADSAGKLIVLALANYSGVTVNPDTMSTDFYPTGVAVAPDKSAFVWHDYLQATPAGQRPPGVYYYENASLSFPGSLRSTAYVSLICSPNSSDNTLFAVKASEVDILSLTDYSTQFSITPPAQSGKTTYIYKAALAANGTTLCLWVNYYPGPYTVLVYEVDLSTKTATQTATLPSYTSGTAIDYPIAIAPDGAAVYYVDAFAARLYAAKKQGNSYSLVDNTGTAISSHPTSMVMDATRNRLYILHAPPTNNTRSISVVDTATMTVSGPTVLTQGELVAGLNQLTMMPDGSRLLASDGAVHGVRVIDPDSLRFIDTIVVNSELTSGGAVAVSADGSTIYVVDPAGARLGVAHAIQPAGGTETTMLGVSVTPTSNQQFFMRDVIGETVQNMATSGGAESPDIIPYGVTMQGDPEGVFLADSSSNCGINDPNCGNSIEIGNPNWVYVRGQNIDTAAQTATISLFYTESDLMLWPQNWLKQEIYYNNDPNSQTGPIVGPGTQCNWIQIKNIAAGAWAVTSPGYIWQPPAFHTGHSEWDHYCLIAFSQTDADKQKVSFDPMTLVNGNSQMQMSQLWDIVRTMPNMVWRNTVDVPPTEHTWTRVANITGPSTAATINVQLAFENIPTDGSCTFQVAGPDGNNYIDKTIPTNTSGANLTWPLNFPANFNTQAVLTYNQGATAPPAGSTIKISAWMAAPPPPPTAVMSTDYAQKPYNYTKSERENGFTLRRVSSSDKVNIFPGMEQHAFVSTVPGDTTVYYEIGSVPFTIAAS